ncbi:MAG: hypothetical protein H6Q70_818 [Firmicutes bacterium]|nr:hypothetical protein [Bacillota bacterium]
MVIIKDRWKMQYPGASVGIMIVNDVCNPKHSDALQRKKAELISELQSKFTTKADLLADDSIQKYSAYYKQYKKTYHVAAQMESIIFKEKAIPCVAALVEAMFMAELKSGLLTAGHDARKLKMPLIISSAKGDEKYIGISGKEQGVKADDMMIQDDIGIISSILYGPDNRTRITESTTTCIFAVYAPAGIGKYLIEEHFNEIIANIRLFAPNIVVESCEIYQA